MVNSKAKDPVGATTDNANRSASLESIPHRARKRSLSTMLTTKGAVGQNQSREGIEAARLLMRTSLPSKPASTSRQSESARLLKLVPDLNQKEVSRLVAALIKKQKRDAVATGKRREKTTTRTVPALFPEKQVPQKLITPEATHSQVGKVPMPARAAAVSKLDALRMLQEAEAHPDLLMSSTPLPATTTERMSHRQDLAEELVHRVSPR